MSAFEGNQKDLAQAEFRDLGAPLHGFGVLAYASSHDRGKISASATAVAARSE
jgi:hypothetical protein